MTRIEFETFMDIEGWSPKQRALWCDYTPCGDAATVRREMKRADGMIEVKFVKQPECSILRVCRVLLPRRLAA